MGLRGTGGQILCIHVVIASERNWVPLRKGLGVRAMGTRVCPGPNPAHDTARVKQYWLWYTPFSHASVGPSLHHPQVVSGPSLFTLVDLF